MTIRQITAQGQRVPLEIMNLPVPNAGADLIALAEGAAAKMLAIDPICYKDFRAKISRLALQMREAPPDADKLVMIQSLIDEFGRHGSLSEDAIGRRVSAWRTLVSKLIMELLIRSAVEPESADAAPLLQRVSSLLNEEEIHGFTVQFADFLRISSFAGQKSKASLLAPRDPSAAYDNYSGLQDRTVAVKHVKRLIKRGSAGYVVLFELKCLDMIGERFGMDAIRDSVMAVSAFLTQSLRTDDAIYQLGDSSLLAVLQTPANEKILTAAMRRVVSNNRDITIQVDNRRVMLRIPLEFEITPIDGVCSAEDLCKKGGNSN
jgi:GGDEF domain-containing protein